MADDKLQNYLNRVKEYGNQQYIPGAYKGDVVSPKYLRSRPAKILASIVLFACAAYLVYLFISFIH